MVDVKASISSCWIASSSPPDLPSILLGKFSLSLFTAARVATSSEGPEKRNLCTPMMNLLPFLAVTSRSVRCDSLFTPLKIMAKPRPVGHKSGCISFALDNVMEVRCVDDV